MSEYGPTTFQLCPKEFSCSEKQFLVKLFQDVKSSYKGRIVKRKDVVRKLFSLVDLIDFFIKSLKTFIRHNIYLWEADQLMPLVTNFLASFCARFCKEQNEIHLMH